MQFLYHAPSLTVPTQESLREYTQRRFNQLSRLLPKIPDLQIKVTMRRERHDFVMSVEIPLKGRPVFIEVRHVNMYAAIDHAYDVIKKVMRKQKERRGG